MLSTCNVTTVVTTVCRLTVAAALVQAGAPKVTGAPAVMDDAERLGYTPDAYRAIGAVSLAGAAGLLIGGIGGRLRWIGQAASLGSLALFTGAVIEHVRHGDAPAESLPAASLGVLSLISLVAGTKE
ncbi:DoxX family protein [Corynebacterium terpenotabidum]|uniref:DoxX family protein n=1 Tax=Corynebacterium terpenotabidum Y-11 TaxID=1200352 RepID=S4XGW0_9CORY|nr:DoxX family protein [Corynebacterium terpenotabidum]AGP29888.1 hypothetical protein A606_01165 [Corynebacterium terpenotabidum Y-11]